MDHEVLPRSCKICDWLLTSSHNHFGLHQGKKCQSDHGVQGPAKTHFKAYTIHRHGPTQFCDGRGKRGVMVEQTQGPTAKKYCYNIFLNIFFGGRDDEDKRRKKNDQA